MIQARKVRRSFVCFVLVAVPAALWAQAGDTGSGTTPMGREGYLWQTDIELAKQQIAEFKADLDRLGDGEWKRKSVAWVAIDVNADDGRIDVPVSYHVGGLDAGKRAEIEADPLDPAWYIAFGKKPPRELELILTDDATTHVSCAMADALKRGRGYFGVFVLENRIFCFFRGADDLEAA